jgi:hypothetical protein
MGQVHETALGMLHALRWLETYSFSFTANSEIDRFFLNPERRSLFITAQSRINKKVDA